MHHPYLIYCTWPAITRRNTETPLPSLLVTSWPPAGQPKIPILFGRGVTLALSFNIPSPNEGNTSWPSDWKNASRNSRTPKSHSSLTIVFSTPTGSPSSTLKRPRTSNFGRSSRAGRSVTRAGNWNPESSFPHSAERPPQPCTTPASAAMLPM